MPNDTSEIKPVAWLYTLEYGTTVANTLVSIDERWYPFGVCGSDYLARNDDGVSYVRETPLYSLPATHRIVPVEMLERCSREFQSMEGTELAYPEHASAVQCYHDLQAIIDKVPT